MMLGALTPLLHWLPLLWTHILLWSSVSVHNKWWSQDWPWWPLSSFLLCKLQMNLSLIPLRCVLDLLNYFNYSYCLWSKVYRAIFYPVDIPKSLAEYRIFYRLLVCLKTHLKGIKDKFICNLPCKLFGIITDDVRGSDTPTALTAITLNTYSALVFSWL
jgi:hypothetical protein